MAGLKKQYSTTYTGAAMSRRVKHGYAHASLSPSCGKLTGREGTTVEMACL